MKPFEFAGKMHRVFYIVRAKCHAARNEKKLFLSSALTTIIGMNPKLKSDRYARAVVFACKKHEGSYRDDGKTPYAVHPIRVCELLRRIADEEDETILWCSAAARHD